MQDQSASNFFIWKFPDPLHPGALPLKFQAPEIDVPLTSPCNFSVSPPDITIRVNFPVRIPFTTADRVRDPLLEVCPERQDVGTVNANIGTARSGAVALASVLWNANAELPSEFDSCAVHTPSMIWG